MVGWESIYSLRIYIDKMKIIQNPHQVILLSLLALVFVADITTTQFLLSNGMGYEANPFMVPFVGIPFAIILVKAAALACLILLINHFCSDSKKWSSIYLIVGVVVSLIPVINNSYWIIVANSY